MGSIKRMAHLPHDRHGSTVLRGSPKSESQFRYFRYLLTLQVFRSTVEGKNLAPVAGTCGTRCVQQAFIILLTSMLGCACRHDQESALGLQVELRDETYSILVDGRVQSFSF